LFGLLGWKTCIENKQGESGEMKNIQRKIILFAFWEMVKPIVNSFFIVLVTILVFGIFVLGIDDDEMKSISSVEDQLEECLARERQLKNELKGITK
jgi:hypothetical protein